MSVIFASGFDACSVPGGTIYLTSELLQQLDNEDELAAVLAHEIAHLRLHHWAKRENRRVVSKVVDYAISFGVPFGGYADLGLSHVTSAALDSFSRKDEMEADRVGIEYLSASHYDPGALISFLDKVSRIESTEAGHKERSPRDHPLPAARIAKAQQAISGLPTRNIQSSSDPKAFAEIKVRLPILADGTAPKPPEMRAEQRSRHLLFFEPPQIVRPDVIDKFDAGEMPPAMRRQAVAQSGPAGTE